MRSKWRYVVPSLEHFLFVTVFLILSLMRTGRQMLADADTGYHIRAGEYILATFSIPKQDIFSYLTPPIPWTAHEWLAEVVMALLHKTFGLNGVVVFYNFLIALTYALLFRFLRSYRRNILFDVVVALLVILSSQIHWLARPHIFSLPLMVIWYAILESYQNDRRNLLYALPFLMILWVNLHGGFVTGFILTGTYFLGNAYPYLFAKHKWDEHRARKTKYLFYTGAACLAASLMNPYGYHILLFPFNLVSNRFIMDNVTEWLSPNFHNPMPFKYLFLLMIGLIAISRARLTFIEVFFVLFFTNMSLYSARYILLFAIIVAPIMSRQAEAIQEDSDSGVFRYIRKKAANIEKMDGSSKGYVWPVASVLLVFVSVHQGLVEFRFDENSKPKAAVDFLRKEEIRQNMYNNDEFGDYLIYETYPQYKVFFDGRSDMYGTERFKEFQKVAGFSPGWEKVIEKYDIQWFFIGSDSWLSRYLLEKDEWKLIYSDNVANIHVRNNEEFRDLIEKYGDVKPVIKKDKYDPEE